MNTDGVGTTIGAVVTGTLHDLNEGDNWGPVKVTLDSIVPDPLGWGTHEWSAVFPSVLHVSGGVITDANLSDNDGTLAFRLIKAGSTFVADPSDPSFTPSYSNGDGDITFTAITTPDGGATLTLLGSSLALFALRNFRARR